MTFLERHWTDVENIYYRHFARRVRSWGLDDADGLQEVYLGLLSRQRGRGAYRPWPGDARRGLGSYIYMVTSCVLATWRDRELRWVSRYRNRVEHSDHVDMDDSGCAYIDPAAVAVWGEIWGASIETQAARDLLTRVVDALTPAEREMMLAIADGRVSAGTAAYRALAARVRGVMEDV